MRMRSSIGFALFGAALTALSFGLARFAFGLFVPPIRDDLGLTPFSIGWIGALPLVSFLLASLFAPFTTDRLGARLAAVCSALLGALGLTLIAVSTTATLLGIGVFLCGLCTGLMMPALTAAMQALVQRSIHGRVSAIMNAGTSIGVIAAVPMALLLAGEWRLAYSSFAVLAGLAAAAAWLFIPSVSRILPANAALPPISDLQWWRLARLSSFAFVMGFISAAYWIFAPDLVVNLGELPAGAGGWLWLAVGVAGLSGAIVADLADRNNPPITHALMLMMLAASLALLAASPGNTLLASFSALVFGASYMSLTGLYLMTGIRLLPSRLSMGPVLPFMACALGQAAGSPVVGLLVDRLGYADTFSVFAAVGITVAVLSPLYPRDLEAETEMEPEAMALTEDTGLQAAYDSQLVDEDGEPLVFAAPEDHGEESSVTPGSPG
ncbi:MFS transporter [Leptolyngbya valderiana BDU 20041]|nr:MFS transporter [Leptolyngbya valderiana BDU 20041]